MINRLKKYYEKIINFIRYGHPYLKTILIIFPFLVGYIIYFFINIIPFATTSSIQSGVTLIAELLGVILGALLVIVVLLIDQLRQADTTLSKAFPKYLDYIKSNKVIIEKIFEKLLKLVKQKKIILTDKVIDESEKTFRETLALVSSVCSAIDNIDQEELENQLLDLGYSEDESIDIVYVNGITATLNPFDFLELIDNAFEIICLSSWFTGNTKMFNFGYKIFEDFSVEGISDAINRHKTADGFLRSRTLSLALGISILSLFLAVPTIFGVTDFTFNSPIILIPLYVSIVGFFLSIFLSLVSVNKMFSIGK